MGGAFHHRPSVNHIDRPGGSLGAAHTPHFLPPVPRCHITANALLFCDTVAQKTVTRAQAAA